MNVIVCGAGEVGFNISRHLSSEDNNITVIYTIYPIESSVIYTYLDKSCLSEKKVSNIIHSYEIKSCYEING